MQFFREKITRLRIGWNQRPLTEDDFYRQCRRFRITVQEMPLVVGGFYYRVLGRDFIAVNSRLTGAKKLAVLFHELGHFLFHTPESGAAASFHGVGRRTRKECEADIFALCALIPTAWIASRSPEELLADGIAAEMITARFKIYERHGI